MVDFGQSMKNAENNPPEVPPQARSQKAVSCKGAVKGNCRFRAGRQNPENKRPQYTARGGKNSHQKPIERYTLYLLNRSLLKQCSQEGRQKPIVRYTLYLLNKSLLKQCFPEGRQKPIERYTLYFVETAVKGNCRFWAIHEKSRKQPSRNTAPGAEPESCQL